MEGGLKCKPVQSKLILLETNNRYVNIKNAIFGTYGFRTCYPKGNKTIGLQADKLF